jgi:hypothetical protein
MSDPTDGPMREPIDRLLRHLRVPGTDVLAAVRSAWPAIVGADLAAVVELVAVHDGDVVVSTRDPAVASELRWRERELLSGVRERGADVTRVVVRLQRSDGARDLGW